MKVIKPKIPQTTEQYVVGGIYMDQKDDVYMYIYDNGDFLSLETGCLGEPSFPVVYYPKAVLRLEGD